jgi:hypothetical protein
MYIMLSPISISNVLKIAHNPFPGVHDLTSREVSGPPKNGTPRFNVAPTGIMGPRHLRRIGRIYKPPPAIKSKKKIRRIKKRE